MASKITYTEASPVTPIATLSGFPLVLDASDFPSGWWDEVDTDDGERGRLVFNGEFLPAKWVDFDKDLRTGEIRTMLPVDFEPGGSYPIQVWSPDASRPLDASNPWDAFTLAAYLHGAGTDFTDNGNDATDAPDLSSVAGKLGLGTNYPQSLGAPQDPKDVAILPQILAGLTEFTYMGWLQRTESGDLVFIGKKPVGGSNPLKLWVQENAGGDRIGVRVTDTGGTTSGNKFFSDVVIPEGTWFHIAVQVDLAAATPILHVFVNAVEDSTSHEIAGVDDISDDAGIEALGGMGDSLEMKGDANQTILATTIRSSAWIKKEYAQTNDPSSAWSSWTMGEIQLGGYTKPFLIEDFISEDLA